jgi:hypothetical protein
VRPWAAHPPQIASIRVIASPMSWLDDDGSRKRLASSANPVPQTTTAKTKAQKLVCGHVMRHRLVDRLIDCALNPDMTH